MDQLLAQFGQTIQGILDSPVVQVGARAVAIYVVLLWLGSAFWAFRDASHRTHNLLAPYAAGALVVLATPLFFPFALILYWIVRPGETLVDAWERRMAEEAAAEAIPLCSGCGRRTDPDWLACPSCGQRLHRRCAACGRLMGLDWNLCAWCGSEPATGVVALPLSVVDDSRSRWEDEVRARSTSRRAGGRPVDPSGVRPTSDSPPTSGRRAPRAAAHEHEHDRTADDPREASSSWSGGASSPADPSSDSVAAFAPSHLPVD
jgi:RNA polymerase subunit RPABC4/transcription elongation factor Spt4